MIDVRTARITERLARRAPLDLPRAADTKTAAVAAIVRPAGDDTEILFIRRAESPHDPWSGHVAFPGGRHDPHDEDLLATAVRETSEEVGLDLRAFARPVGRLDEIEAVARGVRTGLVIRPYVFEVHRDPSPFVPQPSEVAEVLWGRLGPLARGEADTSLRYQREGLDLTLPAYDVQGRTVWGLTYQMLRALFERLR